MRARHAVAALGLVGGIVAVPAQVAGADTITVRCVGESRVIDPYVELGIAADARMSCPPSAQHIMTITIQHESGYPYSSGVVVTQGLDARGTTGAVPRVAGLYRITVTDVVKTNPKWTIQLGATGNNTKCTRGESPSQATCVHKSTYLAE